MNTVNLGSYVALAALVAPTAVQGQNLARYALARDRNGVLGILFAWLLGIVLVLLAVAAPHLSDGTLIGRTPLSALGWGDIVLLGVNLGSLGSLGLVDFRKALDNSDSAKVPPLVPGPESVRRVVAEQVSPYPMGPPPAAAGPTPDYAGVAATAQDVQRLSEHLAGSIVVDGPGEPTVPE